MPKSFCYVNRSEFIFLSFGGRFPSILPPPDNLWSFGGKSATDWLIGSDIIFVVLMTSFSSEFPGTELIRCSFIGRSPML
ncbi:hypothetical protein GDO81_019092 [Engystomops pustulosus]|uniref:Uncharacterized protein n=1 Tax=Engystomops pustulosus TaxID=76066 RepID=A0AAV6ZII0_ENGPU|nr:hypothetical protein GDO81_019092 [Engystomops pustulosus]